MDLTKKIKKSVIDLNTIPEVELLKVRICDLPIQIEGAWLEECIQTLYQELEAKGIVFKPPCYLADEWLTPERETCIGIPFYLANPRLIQIEKKFMQEAEGGTKEWCMKLLRHEAGHAICYAYKLNQRSQWQKLFGLPTEEYGETYKYQPYSKNFVRHLEGYYAQYHPDEDFVETFAVWLTPELNWKARYKGWRAIQKLDFVDQLMAGIKGKKPLTSSARKFWRLSTLRITLQNHYRKRRLSLAEEFPDFHDGFLRKAFVEPSLDTTKKAAVVSVMEKYRNTMIDSISEFSGGKKYLINDVLNHMEKRARELRLEVRDDEAVTILKVTGYVTALIMNYFYTGHLGRKKETKM
ncbi:MAG: hypothetical protein HQL24_09210 [Candidatus Omnitrophica bacterium]|nr:hypothetical protein [Candidatus Omnitrophota bacterium]